MRSKEFAGSEHNQSAEVILEESQIRIGRDVEIVTRGGEPLVIVPGLNYLPVNLDKPEWELSTRSRLAQRGMDIIVRPKNDPIRSSKEDNSAIAMLALMNYSGCSYSFSDGMGIAAPYELTGSTLQGEELEKCLGNEIIIEGEENKDWRYVRRNINDIPTIVGVEFSVNTNDKPRSLPQANSLINVHGNGNSSDFRREIDDLLVSFRADEEQAVWISETDARVTILKGIVGVMSREVGLREGDQLTFLPDSEHLNSVLLIGNGKTDWPVRTEIRGSTARSRMANSVFVSFVTSEE
jgi:hypothetical protein